MTDLFANASGTPITVQATVSTTPAAGTSETWTLSSTTVGSFPQIQPGEQFQATIGPASDTTPEMVTCTTILTGTTATVLRGAQGSTIKTHAIGDPFTPTIDAGFLNSREPTAGDFGYLGWTFDALNGGGGEQINTHGTVYLTRFRCQLSGLAGHVWYYVNGTAGAGLTANENLIGIYDTGQTTAGSATLLCKSVDQSTLWETANVLTSTQTSFTTTSQLTAGEDYFAACLCVGTTSPKLIAQQSLWPGIWNAGLTGLALRTTSYTVLSQTSLPTAITAADLLAPGSSGSNNCFAFWFLITT
jgi:hypothetical protein